MSPEAANVYINIQRIAVALESLARTLEKLEGKH